MIAANGNDLAALSNNDLSLHEEANACAATCTCILSRVQLAAALCSELRIFDVNFIVGRYAIAAAETPPVAVTVAFTRSSFPLVAHMPKDPPLVPEPPVVDREEPSLPWIVSLPLPDVILSSQNRRCCRRSAHSYPPAPASHCRCPRSFTAFASYPLHPPSGHGG